MLRPSNAHRWATCPGSNALQTLYPDDEESEAAREGTAAHFWATEALEGRFHPPGTLAPNGHPIDMEMTTCGQVYLDDVLSHWGAAGKRATVRVEQFLTMHGLIHPECEGTTDTYLIDPDAHRIRVWDYKYGHRDVDPFRNAQGLAYIAGVIEAYELTRDDVKGWEITFVIVQPRNFRAEAVREWKMLGHEAWDRIVDLSTAAYAATVPGAPTQSGPQCSMCSAAIHCEAGRIMAATAMDIAASSVPQEMDDAALGYYLRHLAIASKRLEAMKVAVEEAAISKIRQGASIPYWSLGRGDARERWKTPAAEVIAMGTMLGHALAKPVEAITPAQARKLGVDASVISEYSERPQGSIELIPVDENAAAKAFQS